MENRDETLWKVAEKRIAFKRHLATYIIINCFLWGIWFFTDRGSSGPVPWPAWSSLGWGVGVAFHYFNAYLYPQNAVEKEFEKLKNKE